MLFSECSDNNFYIDGKIKTESLDGEYVYLKTIINNTLLNIDSSLVENDKFKFSGHIDSCTIVEITFPFAEKIKLTPLVFVLEAGKYQCVIDTLSYASGENNENLYDYYLSEYSLYNKLNELTDEYNYAILTKSLNDSLTIDYKARFGFLNKEINELAYNFIYLNNDNSAGALVFLQTYSILTKQQILNILKTSSGNFNCLYEIRIITKQFFTENKSSIGMPYINVNLIDSANVTVPISYYINNNFWILLNFWRSDCQPCLDEIQFLKAIYEKYAVENLIILSISLDVSKELWTKNIKQDQMPWPQFCDFKGWDSEAAKQYAINLLPFNILIDPDGNIVLRGDRQNMLSQKLKEIFEE
ncbi:MAG: TlpA disulfide reductase family protein [Bacteroidales bacterium]|nr:TlpA disulfide reductase family protein [Bacteroidales bacterium]